MGVHEPYHEDGAGNILPELVRVKTAHQHAEQAQEEASKYISALLEVGCALVKSFRAAQSKRVAANKVVIAQQEAVAAFRRVGTCWSKTRALQEAWFRASKSCRQPSRNAAALAAASVAAAKQLLTVEAAADKAAADEAVCHTKREGCEAKIMFIKAKMVEAEALEVVWRRQRDQLRARLGAAYLESLKSRAAAQEAADRRSALQAWCARSENLHLQFEASTVSAVEALRAEAYDTKQVEQAYEAARKMPKHTSCGS